MSEYKRRNFKNLKSWNKIKRKLLGLQVRVFGRKLNREHNEENVLRLGFSHRLFVTESHTGRTLKN